MTLFGIPVARRQVLYLSGDLMALAIASWAAHLVRFAWMDPPVSFLAVFRDTTGATAIFALLQLTTLYVAGAYECDRDYRRPGEWLPLWAAAAVALVMQLAVYQLLPWWSWGRGVTALALLYFVSLLTLWRAMASRVFVALVPPRATLVLDHTHAGSLVAQTLRASLPRHANYPLVCANTHPDLRQLVRARGVRQVVVGRGGSMGPVVAQELVALRAMGVRVVDPIRFYAELTGRIPVRHVDAARLVFGVFDTTPSAHRRTLARLVDVGAASVLLVLSAPVVAVAALAIKLTSPGPVFYSQERLGLHRKPFRIHKLRTMRVDAESATGPVWSRGAADDRITAVGRWLRRTRIDELPQLWNVLRGDMALVGPRPERATFVRVLDERIPHYGLRFSVPPGLTGWAQVAHRYAASVRQSEAKLEYELYGIECMSPALYVAVLLRTMQTVLLRPGS